MLPSLPNKKRLLVLLLVLVAGFSGTLFLLDRVFVDNGTVSLPVIDTQGDKKLITYEGRITYLDPKIYPEDEITYVLAKTTGEEIILLKAEDEKLAVADGLYVKVRGLLSKTAKDKKDVLIVHEVVFE